MSPHPGGARRRWFEAFGAVSVTNGRLFVALVVVGAVAVAEALALAAMTPLKTVMPYVIKVESDGRVTVDEAAAQRYAPKQPEIDYALSKWVRSMLTIDSFLTANPQRNNVLEAYAMTRAKATDEFVEWFRASAPVEAVNKDPTLTREVQVRNLMRVSDRAVIIRVVTKMTSVNQKPTVENQMVTIHYEIVPPKTQKEILENPLGLVITHFEISKDLT